MRGWIAGLSKVSGRFLAVAGLALVPALSALGQAGASYQTVAFTGLDAPGGGVFSGFGLPKLGADGTVAFVDGYGVESGVPRVVASKFGDLRLVARGGDVTPEGGSVYEAFSSVSVAINGRVAFNGTSIPTGETQNGGSSPGIWAEGGGFGIPSELVEFGPVAFRAGNFFGLKAIAQFGEGSAEGLFLLSPTEKFKALYQGDTLRGRLGNVIIHSIFESTGGDSFPSDAGSGDSVDVNESGAVAFKATTTPGPSPTPTSIQAIYTGSTAALKLVAATGDSAPGLTGGWELKDLSKTPSIASNGLVAFSATLGGNEESSSAVFAGPAAALKPIVQAEDSVPTATGVVFSDVFSTAVINETGDVIFKATIRYPNQETREGIWIQRKSGGPVLIAASGVSLPTPSGPQTATAVDFAGPGTFNDLHQFVFRASFDSGEGIYLADTRAVAPWVRPTFPRKARDRVTQDRTITITGTAEDDTGVEKVEYTVQAEKNGRQRLKSHGNAKKKKVFKARSLPRAAKGDARWSFKVPLVVGDNRIEVVATDKLGNVSEPLVLVIRRY